MKKLLYLILFCLTATAGSQLSAADAPRTAVTDQEIPLPPELANAVRQADIKGDSRFFDEFLNMLFYLGLVVLFILILVWFLKRVSTAGLEQGNKVSAIKIVEKRSLSPKTTLYTSFWTFSEKMWLSQSQ